MLQSLLVLRVTANCYRTFLDCVTALPYFVNQYYAIFVYFYSRHLDIVFMD